MKSLHVIPAVAPRYGGPSKAIFEMCRSLREAGCETVVCTTDADGASRLNVPLGRIQTYDSTPTIFFKRQFSEGLKYSRPLARWLRKNVSGFDIVHIHAVFSHACVTAARECREQNVPYIVRPLGTLDPWGLSQKKLRKKLFMLFGAESMLCNASAIHYTAEGERLAVEQRRKYAIGKVIPLGLDLETYNQAGSNQETNIGQREKAPYILFLSRLHPKKGLELLLDAFLPLSRESGFERWNLVVAGEGEQTYVDKLKERARQLGGIEKIIFTGWLSGEAKTRTLRDCQLLALTSHQENFGICVVEALACGIPVLVSTQIDLAQEIGAAEAGWVVPLTTSDVRDAMKSAMLDAESRVRKGQAGIRFAQQFAAPAVASQLISLYRSLIAA